MLIFYNLNFMYFNLSIFNIRNIVLETKRIIENIGCTEEINLLFNYLRSFKIGSFQET